MLQTTVLVRGAPGSGKDTLAEILAQNYGWSNDSMSNALKKVDERFDHLDILKTIDQGGIVDDDIVTAAFQLMMIDYRNGIPGGSAIFTGCFRSQGQVLPKIKIASKLSDFVWIIKLQADDDTLISRIFHRAKTDSRADDQEQTARRRIETYRASEQIVDKELEDLYSRKHRKIKLATIDSTPPISEVVKEFLGLLSKQKV